MPNLYFTVGPARCGKSTYCNSWVKECPNRVVISSDDIRYAMHGMRYSSFCETFVFAIKHTMIRAHLHRGTDVIVDGTNTSYSSIKRILEIDDKAQPIVFNTPKELCIQRAIDTNQSDLIPTINRHWQNILLINSYGNIDKYIEWVKKSIHDRWSSASMPNLTIGTTNESN